MCALGAAFVSMVNISNRCSVGDMVDSNVDIHFGRLRRYFGAANLDLMESAFECDLMYNAEAKLDDGLRDAAVIWGEQYTDSDVRLRAIMLNVIRNKGDFKLPQKFLAKARSLAKEYASNSW